MTESERFIRLATATPAQKARIDAILNGGGAQGNGDPDTRLCKFNEAAKMLRVSRSTLYKMVGKGELEIVHVSDCRRITMRSIVAVANGNRAACEK